ncbi:MAG: serine/threonine protein phosphatase [Clostridia bacterium]|nr:serine/threonine protein phosphatase [Clostridia bacterium]
MGILKRISEAKTAACVPQTLKNEPFSFLKSYVPLSNGQTRLYKELREAVPVIDAAIYKLIRLTGGFEIQCEKEANTKRINEFMQTVPVGAGRYGISEFLSAYFEQLLTYGTAVGEIVTDTKGGFAALFNADIENIELKRSPNGIDTLVCTGEYGNAKPVKYQNLVLFSVLNPEGDSLCGTSLLRGLPFVSGILTKIFTTIGENWERAGNVRYAVTYKPQNDVMDRAYARDRAQQVAKEWGEAMKAGGPVKDFIAVGDVSIKAIGADNQILDCDVPSRLMLEQIVAKTGLPPFMLGFSWSSTERMSSQQADLLTSELEAYRRALTPVILKICNMYLMLSGISDKAKIVWDEISLQDEVEQSRARLYRAQSAKLEQELKGELDG